MLTKAFTLIFIMLIGLVLGFETARYVHSSGGASTGMVNIHLGVFTGVLLTVLWVSRAWLARQWTRFTVWFELTLDGLFDFNSAAMIRGHKNIVNLYSDDGQNALIAPLGWVGLTNSTGKWVLIYQGLASVNLTLVSGALVGLTRYYLYAYESAGVLAWQVSTTAPDAERLYKTGTTSHVFVSTFVTNALASVHHYSQIGNVYTLTDDYTAPQDGNAVLVAGASAVQVNVGRRVGEYQYPQLRGDVVAGHIHTLKQLHSGSVKLEPLPVPGTPDYEACAQDALDDAAKTTCTSCGNRGHWSPDCSAARPPPSCEGRQPDGSYVIEVGANETHEDVVRRCC